MEGALKKVNTIVFDVDGVLTDGRYQVDELGNVRKSFLDKDFETIKELKNHFRIVFLSASNRVNPHIAEMLKIQYIYEPKDKRKRLKEMLLKWGIGPENVIFVGDSFADIKCIYLIPLSFCPSDAVPEVKHSKHVIKLKKKGGNGVVVELHHVLKSEILRRRKYA
jgi:3-deoxy-D-manno-octulosonate 8-phosphate phosphatase (KDO 8-P phosphatase)